MSAKCLPSVGPRLGLCVLLGALSCFGQTQAEITGLITDSSAAVVAGATATVTSQGTNAVRISTTNASGIYSFPALLPGAYDLKIEKTGFRAVEQKSILLQVQQVARIDMVLQVGQVSDTIEVSANPALLNTEDATVGTVIENKRIVELPLNGRNYLQLVAISPNVNVGFGNAGAIGGRMGGTRSEQQISIAGQRKDFNYFTLDGITNTDVNFNTYSILPSIDALQEFKVQTGVYPAEFGREASQINVSTKAGTNDYHGALFEFLRNSVLDAKPYAFTAARPAAAPFKWNQYGFTLGGPISIPKYFDGRNKLFFMSNFEGYRDRKQFQNTYSVPSAAMRTGDFSQILPGTVIKDPLSGSPFAGNLIPSSRFSPIASREPQR